MTYSGSAVILHAEVDDWSPTRGTPPSCKDRYRATSGAGDGKAAKRGSDHIAIPSCQIKH